MYLCIYVIVVVLLVLFLPPVNILLSLCCSLVISAITVYKHIATMYNVLYITERRQVYVVCISFILIS
jgi:hypothetical protein